MSGRVVKVALSSFWIFPDLTFGRNQKFIGIAFDEVADDSLLQAHAIDIGRVQKIDPKDQGGCQGLVGLLFRSCALKAGKTHAAQTNL